MTKIKTYCISFEGYRCVDAESEDEALQIVDEDLHGYKYDITEVEQMTEDE